MPTAAAGPALANAQLAPSSSATQVASGPGRSLIGAARNLFQSPPSAFFRFPIIRFGDTPPRAAWFAKPVNLAGYRTGQCGWGNETGFGEMPQELGRFPYRNPRVNPLGLGVESSSLALGWATRNPPKQFLAPQAPPLPLTGEHPQQQPAGFDPAAGELGGKALGTSGCE